MFFDPLWMYLKALAVTVIVETGMFALIISKKLLRIAAVASLNVLSHILLHLFFTLMIKTSFGYNIWVYIAGEVMVVLFEAVLYRLSSLIPNFKKALLWSFVFNAASIAIGQLINLLL